MAQIYAALILKETINPKTNEPYTINDVPFGLRAEVVKILNGGDDGEDIPTIAPVEP